MVASGREERLPVRSCLPLPFDSAVMLDRNEVKKADR
jgi:hypothetical protein